MIYMYEAGGIVASKQFETSTACTQEDSNK